MKTPIKSKAVKKQANKFLENEKPKKSTLASKRRFDDDDDEIEFENFEDFIELDDFDEDDDDDY